MSGREAGRKSAARRRAVRVHGLDDALRAGAVARALGVPLMLVSAPAAAASMGPAWFGEIARNVEHAYPDLDMEAVFDCGDAAGYAMAALRCGIKAIRFSGRPAVARKIEDIATASGARLVGRLPRILDARDAPDADTALRQWLGKR